MAAGRNPDDIKVFMGLNVIVGATEELAWAKHAEYLSYASAEAGVAHFSASTAIDFAEYELDEPIQYVKSNAIQSATKHLQNNDWTRRKLLDQHALGGRYITVVGSPQQVADELESWIAETGLDGFNLTRRVRGLPLWFSMASHGAELYRQAIAANVNLAHQIAKEIGSRSYLKLVRDPQLSVVVFEREGWDLADYEAWSEKLLADQFAFVVPSSHQGAPNTRFAIVNPLTKYEDLVKILDSME